MNSFHFYLKKSYNSLAHLTHINKIRTLIYLFSTFCCTLITVQKEKSVNKETRPPVTDKIVEYTFTVICELNSPSHLYQVMIIYTTKLGLILLIFITNSLLMQPK